MIKMLWPVIRSEWFRRVELQQLMNLTARAFGKPARRLWTLPADKALQVYAEYTRDNLQQAPTDELIRKMNDEAFRMGRRLRRVFRLRTQADVERLTIELYRHIGITLEGHLPGRLCFHECFFSRYYTPDICLAASALDEGIMRGLMGGGGRLCFHQRITDGAPCCQATMEESPPASLSLERRAATF